jgi:hypothetical protein
MTRPWADHQDQYEAGEVRFCENVSEVRAIVRKRFYIQLVEVEAAFKTLKDDLQLRPI